MTTHKLIFSERRKSFFNKTSVFLSCALSAVLVISAIIFAVLIINKRLAINGTGSLPGQFYWLEPLTSEAEVKRGEIVGFYPPDGAYIDGLPFLKVVMGVPGDEVSRIGHADGSSTFLINNQVVGVAKSHPKVGVEPLEPGPVGRLGANEFFVATDHADSYDSRYKKIGWIQRDAIFTRAKLIF